MCHCLHSSPTNWPFLPRLYSHLSSSHTPPTSYQTLPTVQALDVLFRELLSQQNLTECESGFMGATGYSLPPPPPQREYIDRREEEKAAFSASVIKPTSYKYSLSLSRSVSIAIISRLERYISIYPGNEEFLSRNLSFRANSADDRRGNRSVNFKTRERRVVIRRL